VTFLLPVAVVCGAIGGLVYWFFTGRAALRSP
jgi:hypothetical protein